MCVCVSVCVSVCVTMCVRACLFNYMFVCIMEHGLLLFFACMYMRKCIHNLKCFYKLFFIIIMCCTLFHFT